MVPALMAFEKDRTLKSRKSPVSLKNCRSPFSFLHFPSQAQQQTTQLLNKRMLFSPAPYHKPCFTSAATDGRQQHRHRLTQSDENGKKWKNLHPYESFFPVHLVIIEQDRGDLSYP